MFIQVIKQITKKLKATSLGWGGESVSHSSYHILSTMSRFQQKNYEKSNFSCPSSKKQENMTHTQKKKIRKEKQ